MPLDVILGSQWGDEGKGRITDLLAAEADVVARFNGGDNAGHSVTVGDRLFKLHLVPSGIVHSHTTCLLGNGMVINPAQLLEEIDQLDALGIDVSPDRLKLSSASHIITPAHLALDGARETKRDEGGLGTTRRGIGPAYTDKAARDGLRAGAMEKPEDFASQIEAHMRSTAEILDHVYGHKAPEATDVARTYYEHAVRLQPYLADVGALLADSLEQGKVVLAEGAQGTLLDLDHGTYPYVTSSTSTVAGALLGLGIGPKYLRRIIGVTKCFQTRVGTGPFPTELFDDTAERLRGTGEQPWDEFGTTTGRPRRCGWLDGVLLRYAARINSLSELALTKLDVLSGIDPIRLCVAYQHEGNTYEDLPSDPASLGQYAAQYEELPGWIDDLTVIHRWDDLPYNTQAYVHRVQALTGLPVHLISVGPERDQVVRLGNEN
ncbi:MAG: adenylosuccinate synthase [Anaerolineales bacterium]|nr:adenylosuccinate synthase [Anaerolineales bacterium]